jgi:hypothetical protein
MTYANALNIIEGAKPTTKQQLQHPAARYLCYTMDAIPARRWLPGGLRANDAIRIGRRGSPKVRARRNGRIRDGCLYNTLK